MTVLEAILTNPVLSDVPLDFIKKTSVERTLDLTEMYSTDYIKGLELVTADVYASIALMPEFKEGQLAIKYDTDKLLNTAKQYYIKHNDSKAEDFEPKPINVGISSVDA